MVIIPLITRRSILMDILMQESWYSQTTWERAYIEGVKLLTDGLVNSLVIAKFHLLRYR